MYMYVCPWYVCMCVLNTNIQGRESICRAPPIALLRKVTLKICETMWFTIDGIVTLLGTVPMF